VSNAEVIDPDELALVGSAGVDLIEPAPAVGRVHEPVVDQRVDLGLGAVLPHILHAAERHGPDHAQLLDIVAVDLGELGIALRAVVAVHHEPVLRLVLGIEQALLVHGYPIGRVLRVQRQRAQRKGRGAGERDGSNLHSRFSPMLHDSLSLAALLMNRRRCGKSVSAMVELDNGDATLPLGIDPAHRWRCVIE
jgi:hypothetical protein